MAQTKSSKGPRKEQNGKVGKVVKVTRSVAAKRLGDVPQDKQFLCQDGRVLKNLRDLEVAFRQMSDDTFHHHATETRNDFSNWVRDVIGDEKLARDLKKKHHSSPGRESCCQQDCLAKKQNIGRIQALF